VHAPVAGMPLYTCHVPWSASSASDAGVGVPLCAVFLPMACLVRLGKYVGFFTTIAALAFKKEYTLYCSYEKLLIFSTLMVCDDSYA
jgi:hypothetical protein